MRDHKNIMNPKSDKRPPINGWCDGEYSVICSKCKDHYIGDKRSWHCADCAYNLAEDYESKPKLDVWKISINDSYYYDSERCAPDFELSQFLEYSNIGDTFSVTKQKMTVEEYEKLPEFQGF